MYLEVAFKLTNHGDGDWTRNPGVRTRVKECRSTSVGDILVTPNFGVYRVANVGFLYLFGLE